MLSRRSLIGGTAALAAGISSVGCSFSAPGIAREAEVTWAVRNAAGLKLQVGTDTETYLYQAVRPSQRMKRTPWGQSARITR